MSNKGLTIISVILILLLAGSGIFVWRLYSDLAKYKATAIELGTKLTGCESEAEKLGADLKKCKTGTKEIQSAQLEIFPAGIIMEPGAAGVPATVFKKEDQVGISGEAFLSQKAFLTFQITDESGDIVQKGAPGMEVKGSGGFGMCCINLPDLPGKYNLKLFLDGEESKALSFEIIP